MVKIRFSPALKGATNSVETTFVIGNTTLRTVIDKLIQQFGPDFEKLILDKGEIKRFVNLYINSEDLRDLKGLDSPVKDSDEISILPAMLMGLSRDIIDDIWCEEDDKI